VRWAKERGLPRTAGHEAGEASLFDCVEGAIELGIGWLSVCAVTGHVVTPSNVGGRWRSVSETSPFANGSCAGDWASSKKLTLSGV